MFGSEGLDTANLTIFGGISPPRHGVGHTNLRSSPDKSAAGGDADEPPLRVTASAAGFLDAAPEAGLD